METFLKDIVGNSAAIIMIVTVVSTVIMQLILWIRTKERMHEKRLQLMEFQNTELQRRVLGQQIDLLHKELERVQAAHKDAQLTTALSLVELLSNSLVQNASPRLHDREQS